MEINKYNLETKRFSFAKAKVNAFESFEWIIEKQ
jgi:hypothetical protein